ncbi:MAG: (2Fe-2S)-binding protein [Rhizobiaceae bacterium]
MIVCHCNMILQSEIEQVIESLLDEDPWRLIVPLQVYHEMDKRGRCCGCFPTVVDLIVKVTEAYHKRNATPEAEIVSLVDRLKSENDARERARRAARQQQRHSSAA